MRPDDTILGIDIGSVSISVAEVGPEKNVVRTFYRFHEGSLRGNLEGVLNQLDLSRICGIAATSSTPPVLHWSRQYDHQISTIAACRHLHEELGAILTVGGEKFSLISFDDGGNYRNLKTNSSCAAGTGSFLDQQAQRLNLGGVEELAALAAGNQGALPKIASRCAVFAKTDLAHAQQEGYSIEEICDGLCHGLAKNIVDTLFAGEDVDAPILFTGGVSRNVAVVRHLSALIDRKVIVNSRCLGAIGTAFNLIDDWDNHCRTKVASVRDFFAYQTKKKQYFHPPLELVLSKFPDFKGVERCEYRPNISRCRQGVEVDIYAELKSLGHDDVFLGIDIGSTSTKAVLLTKDKTVLAGFYTRTAGKPVEAVQSLFAAIEDLGKREKIDLRIIGAGTTGSGRKMIGKIIGADLVIDEITTQARAAVALHSDVDTIIEIGGQDSKFTTLSGGMVTLSVMNNVCAAGTGSFIEEQAQRLGVRLEDFTRRAESRRSPIASDRCTVFMERDVNHYLTEGYSVEEVLASVLHSVRENYLTKVATESLIGDTVVFQGATAKNRALVAAFEQRLEKPIHVSKYCHLTGALGAALSLADENIKDSSFRGTGVHKTRIPLRSEVCDLCTNHCKITVAEVDEEKVGYGFLCGRDYETKKFVNNNLSGFDLLVTRKKVSAIRTSKEYDHDFTVGIPAALHLQEDVAFWRTFFESLSIRTVTSERYKDALEEGKKLTGTEFCAPMSALYGHAAHLLERADYVFLPFYFENRYRENGVRRQYCYYTQFAPSLVSTLETRDGEKRFLTPLIHYLYSSFHTKTELFRMLRSISDNGFHFAEVSSAHDEACELERSRIEKLKEIYKKEARKDHDIHVVLLGRPYTVLSESMNKGIPNLFASAGVKVFYQDMLSGGPRNKRAITPLLQQLHWHYASEILAAAELVAETDHAYPVLMSSFKCSPDSFAMDYFRKIMESHKKPYLVLQLDGHDSRIGYETRIEAGLRSFRSHAASKTKKSFTGYGPSLVPSNEKKVTEKTILFPNWDSLSTRLIVANLQRMGIDARVLEESESSIRKSLRYNTEQCLPLNIIAQEVMDYVETHHLNPEDTALWTFGSDISCNIKLYPHQIANIFRSRGNGFEKLGVHVGGMSLADISPTLPFDTYFAYMFGGFIRRMACRIRPYEKVRGSTDTTVEKSMNILAVAFLGRGSKEQAVVEIVELFQAIGRNGESRRPKVALFGDLYARDNDVLNQNIIRFIEDHGGEVITTPYSCYIKMVAKPYFRKWFMEGHYLDVLVSGALMAAAGRLEKRYYKMFKRVLGEPEPEYDEPAETLLAKYNVRVEHTGESMDNLLKIYYVQKYHPDVALFVQASPAFCCPSLVTEAMAKRIEKVTGVPIVSITYDGTGGSKNDIIIPYLKYPKAGARMRDRSREEDRRRA